MAPAIVRDRRRHAPPDGRKAQLGPTARPAPTEIGHSEVFADDTSRHLRFIHQVRVRYGDAQRPPYTVASTFYSDFSKETVIHGGTRYSQQNAARLVQQFVKC